MPDNGGTSQPFAQDVEKDLQLCSLIAQRFNVRQRVRVTSSHAPAGLEGLFEYPAVRAGVTSFF
jgi:hypothetical protein